ncbi:unnamed protein product [Paramecium sonneborni]|uniref:DH domain-containing protein n=1 Tax=Paramecium sonneborni TaxID=65129 RepID=A0A8S1MAA1_9CILI|nr:unnamed protein product [Paramecium sonneborni]
MQDDRVRYMNSVYSEHRKDLSKNMDVVCFAMAVELDRLVQENNLLKEEVREISNLRVDRLNYEKQIGDLMNRLQQLIAENDMLKRDNEKIKAQLNQANQKAQQLEGQVSDYLQEIQTVSNKLEDITGGDGDFDIEALKQKAELLDSLAKDGQSMEDLSDLLDSLREKAEKYDHHLELLNGRELEDVLNDLDELEKLRKLVKELQAKLNELQKESDLMKKKSKELDDMKKKLGDDPSKEVDKLRKQQKEQDDLKKKLTDALKEIEQLKKLLNDKTAECNRLGQQVAQLTQDNQVKDQRIQELERYAQQYQELQIKVNKLEQELDNVQRQLKDKSQQLEDKTRLIDNLNREIQQLKAEIQRLKDLIANLEREKQQLLQQQQQMQNQLAQCQDQLRNSQAQLQQLNSIANQNDDEKEKYEQEIDELKNEIDSLKEQIEELNDEIARLKRKIQEQDDQIDSQTKTISNKISRIKELEDLLNQKEKAIKEQELKIKKLPGQSVVVGGGSRGQSGQLGQGGPDGINKSMSNQLQGGTGQPGSSFGLKSGIGGLGDDSQTTIMLSQYQDVLLAYLLIAAENERISEALKHTVSDFELVLVDLRNAEGEISYLKKSISDLQAQINDLRFQLDEARRKSMNNEELERLRRQLTEYENKLALLSMELQRQKTVSGSGLQGVSSQIQMISQQNTYGYEDKQINFDQQFRSPKDSQRNLNVNIVEDESWRLKKIIEDQLCLIVLMSAELETLRSQDQTNARLSSSGIQGQRSTIQTSQVQVGYGKSAIY